MASARWGSLSRLFSPRLRHPFLEPSTRPMPVHSPRRSQLSSRRRSRGPVRALCIAQKSAPSLVPNPGFTERDAPQHAQGVRAALGVVALGPPIPGRPRSEYEPRCSEGPSRTPALSGRWLGDGNARFLPRNRRFQAMPTGRSVTPGLRRLGGLPSPAQPTRWSAPCRVDRNNYSVDSCRSRIGSDPPAVLR